MKSISLFSILLTFFILSCNTSSFLKKEMTMDDLLAAKENIDNLQNPAEILLLKNSLSEKILILKDITVKDIVNSTNVDYDFCVLADIQTEKGPIECYIYTRNIRRISQLKKAHSIITVRGEFRRYFSMLDNYYTKIEITNATITIKNE